MCGIKYRICDDIFHHFWHCILCRRELFSFISMQQKLTPRFTTSIQLQLQTGSSFIAVHLHCNPIYLVYVQLGIHFCRTATRYFSLLFKKSIVLIFHMEMCSVFCKIIPNKLVHTLQVLRLFRVSAQLLLHISSNVHHFLAFYGYSRPMCFCTSESYSYPYFNSPVQYGR